MAQEFFKKCKIPIILKFYLSIIKKWQKFYNKQKVKKIKL